MPQNTPDQQQTQAIIAFLADVTDVLNRTGKHADHTPKQVGRCVICSCGVRAQGRLAKKG